MKFIVDELPLVETDCPFFINGRCFMNHNWACDRFNYLGCVIDQDAKECAMLKEQSDED